MAKEKPLTNTEEILNKLKTSLKEKESRESLENKQKRIRLSQEQNKRFLEKKEKGQIFKAEDKLIEAIFPHYKKEKIEEDVPQIIVMENKKEQPIKIKEDRKKMPKVEKIDGKIGAPRVGSKFFMMNEEKKMENYTIIGTRISKKDGSLLLRIKKNPEDREEEPKEINSKQFISKFDKQQILLTIKDDKRIEELAPFSKKRKEENEKKRNKKEKDVLSKIAENADKNREELEKEGKKENLGIKVGAEASKDLIKKGNRLGFNKTQIDNMSVEERDLIRKATEVGDVGDLWRKYNVSEPKNIDELTTHHTIGKKIDEVLLKSFNDIEQKKLKEKLSNAKTNIQKKLKGKSITDSKEKESKEFLDKINKERDDFEKQRKERIKAEQDKKIEEGLENKKDQARKEYIEAKNQKQPFWKFGFGSKKREQEIKEKEEAYMKAKKEYFEASGKDKMDFLLEEKRKFQTENIEKKGLSERIKNGINKTLNVWENWDKNEKDSKFTQELKKAGKTFIKIAIIGGASVITVYGLAGIGIGTATALAGGIGSYVGKKAVMGTAFASAINSVPPKHRGWVSKTILVGSLGWAAYSTAGIGAIAGIAGYMGSKLIKNKSEENIKAEVAAKIEALKEKQNQKIEKESFEDFEKRQNAIEKELALIEKTANKDRFYRNAKKGALALLIGTATIEMSGAMQDYRDHHQSREYVPRDHDPIPKTEHHTTPIQETHKINPDAIIHKGEGIENAFIRQIEHNTEIAKSLGWDGKENLHHFAQHEAHALAIKEGYVDTNGNEIRVNVADKVGYEIKIENGHATVFEKSLDGKLTDTAHHEGDSFEKNTEKYEYKTTGNAHLEKPVPTTEQSEIHLEKPTPVLENIQTNHPQELQADAPRLQFEERTEPALNLQYEHPKGDAGVMDPSSGVRNVNAFYTANHNEGPTNYQNNYNNGYQNHNVVYRNINPEQYYQNHIEHQHQIVEQATKLHDHNIHQIFPRSNDYGEYADKPVRDYLKMEPEDTENPAEKELIKHIHNVHASTDLKPIPGNLFRNPETIEHYLDRAYEEAIKQGKIKEVVIE